jgi:hypothetical protein
VSASHAALGRQIGRIDGSDAAAVTCVGSGPSARECGSAAGAAGAQRILEPQSSWNYYLSNILYAY